MTLPKRSCTDSGHFLREDKRWSNLIYAEIYLSAVSSHPLIKPCSQHVDVFLSKMLNLKLLLKTRVNGS